MPAETKGYAPHDIDAGPHDFVPLRWRDHFLTNGDCKHCWVRKSEHPIAFYVPARPVGVRIPQRTFVYCPSCRWEMVAGGRWLGQEIATMAEGYDCARCGCRSVWDFDCPAPVLLRSDADG